MKRWNGWGDESRDMQLNADALQHLKELIGVGTPLPVAAKEAVLKTVPPSRAKSHPQLDTDPFTRVMHARGQSLPDWLAMKSGDFGVFPDAVALPTTNDDVRALVKLAEEEGYKLIPYGGGTSVAGHITPDRCDQPQVTVSMRRMNTLLHLDDDSQIATIGAGANGPEVESQLRGRGYTLGHFPQSFELSTLGGWVATRSSGQQSLRYGRIEQMFAGGQLITPTGDMEIPPFPASSAGPDMRELVMGSEGRLGFITDVKVRVTPIPEAEEFYALFFPSWHAGVSAVKAMTQARIDASMMRLSNPIETVTNLALAGHKHAVSMLEGYLKWRGANEGKSMLIIGFTGSRTSIRVAKNAAFKIIGRHGGVQTGTILGKRWAEGRFKAPYLRECLWHHGYMVDTVESATPWNNINRLIGSVEGTLSNALEPMNEKVHVFTHLSHVYPQGSSCYTTFVFRAADTYAETYRRWQRLKQTVSEAIVTFGGTISHQHGVGKDHKSYLVHEKDEVGMQILAAMIHQADPKGTLNPGTLL